MSLYGIGAKQAQRTTDKIFGIKSPNAAGHRRRFARVWLLRRGGGARAVICLVVGAGTRVFIAILKTSSRGALV